MRFKTRVFISHCICLFGVIAILISCVEWVAMCRPFYSYVYKQLHTAKSIGMEDVALYDATDTLLDYMQDYRDDIVVKVEVHGVEREVFDERETSHMVDVKNLYQNVLLVRNACVILCILLLALLMYDNKKGTLEAITYTYKRFIVYFSLVLFTLITYAACDFTTFWTYFHEIFFTNDLWLLDPRISIMINMFPEPFFFAMVFAIAALFICILVCFLIFSCFYQKQRMKEDLVN